MNQLRSEWFCNGGEEGGGWFGSAGVRYGSETRPLSAVQRGENRNQRIVTWGSQLMTCLQVGH